MVILSGVIENPICSRWGRGMHHAGSGSIIQPGSNCWRMENSGRVAFAVDGETCFCAVREAILSARHTVFILGLDIHSRLQLVRDVDNDDSPREPG